MSPFSHLYLVYFYEQGSLMDLYNGRQFLEESLGSSYSSAWLSVFGKYHKLKQLIWPSFWDLSFSYSNIKMKTQMIMWSVGFYISRAHFLHSMHDLISCWWFILQHSCVSEAVKVDNFNSTTESGGKILNVSVQLCTLNVLHLFTVTVYC